MIYSSLLWYVTQNGSPQSPCSLWEQEFNRYSSTVNRVFCLMQWYDRGLTAFESSFGMSHRTALSEPLFSVETGVQSLSVNRVYASAWIAANKWSRIVFKPDRFRKISWFNTRSLKQCVFSSDLNVITSSAVILVLIIRTLCEIIKAVLLKQY